MTRGISIVIPTYNRAPMLRPTLASLALLNIPGDVQVEVLVIDNNCKDETPRVVADFKASAPMPVRHIVETRQGHCVSRNRGFREAAFDHVVDFDDDVDVYTDWIAGYFDAVDRLGADCVVGPVYPVFEVAIPAYMTQRVLQLISSTYSRKGGQAMVLTPDVAHEVPGCNFGVRKEVALALGGFRPDWGRNPLSHVMISQDDFDFGRRLVASGKRVVYEPRCAIHHRLSSEKLARHYLRRRFYGDGATKRLVDALLGFSPSPSQRIRYFAGALHLLARAAGHALAGKASLAFECELEARQALGYVCHKPRSENHPGEPSS